MTRIVYVHRPGKFGQDIALMIFHGLHLAMDVITFGLWIPVHVRSTQKAKLALVRRGVR